MKIYELEYEVYKIINGFYRQYIHNNLPITLKELVGYGFNGIYELNGRLLGYDLEHFTDEQLQSYIKVIAVDRDNEDFLIVYIEFK